MDTKWKRSRKVRGFLAVTVLLVVVVANMGLFFKIGDQASLSYHQREKDYFRGIDYGSLSDLIHQTSEALYVESWLRQENEKDDPPALSERPAIESALQEVCSLFYNWQNEIDYYVETEYGTERNTGKDLPGLLDDSAWKRVDPGEEPWYQKEYAICLVVQYDAYGDFFIQQIWDGGTDGEVERTLRALAYPATDLVVEGYYGEEEAYRSWNLGRPKSMRGVYGIPKATLESYFQYDNAAWFGWRLFALSGSLPLYIGSLALLLIAMVLLTSNKIWRGTITWKRPWILYGMEGGILAVFGVIAFMDAYVGLNQEYYGLLSGKPGILELLSQGNWEFVGCYLGSFGILLVIYSLWYVALLFLRPVFSLGVREYVRQYSLCYAVCSCLARFTKRKWRGLKAEVEHIDFGKKGIKTIGKVVLVNFLILSLISFFWIAGIPLLAVYSVGVFFLARHYYARVKRDYQFLMAATTRIGEGNLQMPEKEEDWGIFEPFKKELDQIRGGLAAAVEKEVRAQRMKTELITNVSHDLKTPLTAITTYVELLKDPELAQEQREAYIETLERKSLRLKVLIEDLFEVSKASSQDIHLNLMQVDIVNLLKQVSVEYKEPLEEKHLMLKWSVPEEKVTLMLDNQKSYRIFDNLFSNIEKYAMPGSRVYVEVKREGGQVSVTMKNMSATELNLSAQELTERFVRGDASRNTEGSGLGLAIVQSFTEAQRGRVSIEVDGDLFKVRLEWDDVSYG